VEITMALCLPRDAASVSVVRRIARQALRSVGFEADDVADMELALGEAATNVLRHSLASDQYEVRVELVDAELTIEVVDAGRGFDGEGLGRGDAMANAETGRGIQLMRALADDVRFNYRPNHGSVVRMVKTLRLEANSPLATLQARLAEADSVR